MAITSLLAQSKQVNRASESAMRTSGRAAFTINTGKYRICGTRSKTHHKQGHASHLQNYLARGPHTQQHSHLQITLLKYPFCVGFLLSLPTQPTPQSHAHPRLLNRKRTSSLSSAGNGHHFNILAGGTPSKHNTSAQEAVPRSFLSVGDLLGPKRHI